MDITEVRLINQNVMGVNRVDMESAGFIILRVPYDWSDGKDPKHSYTHALERGQTDQTFYRQFEGGPIQVAQTSEPHERTVAIFSNGKLVYPVHAE